MILSSIILSKEEDQMNRRNFIKSFSLGLTASSICLGNWACSSKPKRPNIIFLLTDDQRWDALSCAGNPIIQTPNMDFLAKNGTRFENAFVTTPICAASRASIFTGLYERTHGYTFGQPPLKQEFAAQSYSQLLRQIGYSTGFVGKFGIKVSDETKANWFDYFYETRYPYFRETENGQKRHLTDINFDHALDFIKKTNREQPFCLSISTWAPHAHDNEEQQYFWPESCDDLYEGITIPEPELSDPDFFGSLPGFIKKSLNRTRWYWRFDTQEKYQKMVKGYYRMITGVDKALGRLMDELKKRNLHQNTIIILMGDNGYFLGERGYAGKWTMHDRSIRVPFIFYDPRNQKNAQKINEFVLNIDLAPTLLDLAGINIPSNCQGKSLLPLMRNDFKGWRKEVLTEHLWDRDDIPQTEAVRTKRWKYIRYQKHPEYEELYYLKNDPNEAVNLAQKDEFNTQLNKMRDLCDRKINEIVR